MNKIVRPVWVERLHRGWESVPIVWLSGLRRTGKTTLAQSLPSATYLNCDLPSTTERLSNPEFFYKSLETTHVVFDEVHQLLDPSTLLKIGADAFPHLKILATGSSTLAATEKFRDSLSGRKRMVQLSPVLCEELPPFGVDLDKRLLWGGFPGILLGTVRNLEAYSEWLDSFYARDIQELFRVEKRAAFLKLIEVLLRQSGGLCELSALAREVELSRPTTMHYLDVLEMTHAIHRLRPYHGGNKHELHQQPKIYGFDTGFVAFVRGWNELRREDRGQLWEHLVLDTLQSIEVGTAIHYWRDKQQHEVDFIVPRGRNQQDAFECKWSADAFDPKGLLAFRKNHPHGENYLVAANVGEPYELQKGGLRIHVLSAQHLRSTLRGRTYD